jgi:hypothetical protein
MGNADNRGESPFKEGKSEAGKGDSAPAGSTPLNDEASRLLAERKHLQQESAARLECPALNAMAARSVYYGLQGRLLPGMDQITKVMSQSGQIGDAALSRMQALADKGWKFGPMGVNDEFLVNHTRSPLVRFAKTFIQGGYNDAQSGKIAYNRLGSLMNTVVGISDGADKDAAYKYIHELAHGKYAEGYRMYEATPAARDALHRLPAEAQIAHGREMVQEELRAVTAQVAASVRQQGDFRALRAPQTGGLSNYPLEAALRHEQLGAVVKDAWPYEGTKALSVERANAAGADYMKSNYGDLFKDGALNPQAEKSIAAEISRLPVVPPSGEGRALSAAGAATAETAFSSSRYFNYLSRGGQALGSLVLLSTVADVHNQFRISTGSGVGRLVGVSSDLAGFEGGAYLGGWVGKGVTQALIKSNPKLAMVALPLFTMGSGLVASQLMHDAVSKPIEQKTQKEIDELLARQR